MRTLQSLLDAGYVPKTGQKFYKTYSLKPSLVFKGVSQVTWEKKFTFEPDPHDDLDRYYLHPYFPDEPVMAVKMLKPMPCMSANKVYYLNAGVLTIDDNINFDEVLIYNYPTFFQPLYEKYHNRRNDGVRWS